MSRRKKEPPLSEQALDLISPEGKALAGDRSLSLRDVWDRLSPEDRELVRLSAEGAQIELEEHQEKLVAWMKKHKPEIWEEYYGAK